MKKFYSLMLTALTVLLASFSANAALSVQLQWNEPDALQVWVGAMRDDTKVSLPAGATSYTAVIDSSWGSTYVGAASGYAIDYVMVNGTQLTPMYNGNYNINMEANNGQIVTIKVDKILYDGTLNVNVINGREKLSAYFWGTNREVTFHTGTQTIPYSTKFEEGIKITAPADGAVEPYIKQDGVEMEWQTYYNWDTELYHKYKGTSTQGFGFDEGTDFEIKYCDTDDDPEVVDNTATVTLYLQGKAAAAIGMIRNVTQSKSISERDQFEVNKGDVIRFSCYTKDYDVEFNGTPLTASATENYTTKEFTVNEDMTITVSATEREYGNVTLTFYANDIEGLVFTDGGGNVIDPATITRGGQSTHRFTIDQTSSETLTVYSYTLQASAKWGKAFVAEKEGYWMKYSEAGSGEELNTTTMMGVDAPALYVWTRPIVKDSKLSVWMRYNDQTVTAPVLRERDGTTHELTNDGYTEIMVDAEYSSPISASTSWNEDNVDVDNDPTFAMYVDGAAVSQDSDTGQYKATISGNTAIHIVAGKSATPVNVTSNVTADAWAAGASITVDHITELSATKTTVTSITGCDAVVNPAGEKFYINGQEVDEDYSNRNVTKNDDGTYTIKLSSATNSFAIGDFAKMNVSYNGTRKSFIIAFPNASLVEYIEDEDEHEPFQITNTTNQYSQNFTISEVPGAAVPTFSAYCTDNLIGGDTFTFMIPAGAFKVNGMVFNEDDTFETELPLDMTNVAVVFNPMEGDVYAADFYPTVIFVDADDPDPEFFGWNINGINDRTGITLSYNGTALTYNEEWYFSIEKNYFMISLADEAEEGIYNLNIAADAIKVGGTAYPKAITATWTVKSHPMRIAANLDDEYSELLSVSDLESLENIYIRFPEAETVTINDEAGAILSSTDADYDEFGEISEVAGTEKPTFEIAFKRPTVNGDYNLSLEKGTFTIDGYHKSPARSFDLKSIASAITGIQTDADGRITVITIDGRVLMQNAAPEAVKDLKGLYIINGRKELKK